MASISQLRTTPPSPPSNAYEILGIEDPRITLVNSTYYIDYVAVSPRGVTTYLASTHDFRSFERHGVIFAPENKDVVLFPEQISGKYFALHRPHSALFSRNDMWVAESPDLRSWGNHRHLMGLRHGMWDETRIGAGAPPVPRERRLAGNLPRGQSRQPILSRSRPARCRRTLANPRAIRDPHLRAGG